MENVDLTKETLYHFIFASVSAVIAVEYVYGMQGEHWFGNPTPGMYWCMLSVVLYIYVHVLGVQGLL